MHTKSYLHFRDIYWRYQTILLEMNLNLCINAGFIEMALDAESEGRWFDSNLICFGKRFVFTPRCLYSLLLKIHELHVFSCCCIKTKL